VTAYELGYIFNPKYQGRGLATEAGRALIEYAFTEMKVHRIVANCNPEHQKSWRLAERLGLQREGVLKQNIYFREVDGMPKWLDTAVYGLVNHRERARS
jgi:RimJ/RimL family protein N-acetyltransferase